MKLKINTATVSDESSRDAFEIIKSALEEEVWLKGTWRFLDMKFDKAGTFKIEHRLPFQPLDALLLSRIGVGAVSFEYSRFDRTHFVITTTDAVRARFFIGKAE